MSCNQLKDTIKVKVGALNRGDQGPVQRVVVSCNQLKDTIKVKVGAPGPSTERVVVSCNQLRDTSKVKVGALNRGDQGPVQREWLCPATN